MDVMVRDPMMIHVTVSDPGRKNAPLRLVAFERSMEAEPDPPTDKGKL